MNKQKLIKIFLLFIILQPVFDLITSVSGYYLNIPVSFNVVIKMLYLVLLFVYIIFFNNSKYKKISLIYIGIVCTYSLLYIITKNNYHEIITECSYLFKYNYWSLLILGYINLFNDLKIKKEDLIKVLEINALLYFIFLFIPFITKTSLYSYSENAMGLKGWFYSANEMSSLLSLLLPLVFLIFTKKKKDYKDYIILVFTIISLGFIGTKTSFISLILTLILMFMYYVIKNIKKKSTWVLCIIFIFALVLGYKYIPGVDILRNNNDAAHELVKEEDNVFDILSKYLLRVRRDLYFEKKEMFNKSSIVDKLFGIGFTNRKAINNDRITKLVEIDPADIFFGYGMIGFIIQLLPFVYLLYILIKNKLVNILKFNNIIYLYVVLLSILISIFTGHVFGAPSVSIYLSIAYSMLLLNYDEKK